MTAYVKPCYWVQGYAAGDQTCELESINPCDSFPSPLPPDAGFAAEQSTFRCHSIRVHDLLRHLHRVFDKEPAAELVFRLGYDGGLHWEVFDGVLITTVTGGTGVDLEIDLRPHTLATLINALALQTGYSILYSSPAHVDLSALVLLDASNDIGTSNGDHFYGYTSLLWSYLSALAGELDAASAAICEMLRQMSIRTASDYWLDVLGGYYKVARIVGEPDSLYGPRIIAETLRPKSNNMAIAAAITEATGQAARVIDAAVIPPAGLFHDATYLHDGSITHSGNNPGGNFGLFNVEVQYDIFGDGDVQSFMSGIIGQVNRLRAAGTFLHQIVVGTCSVAVDVYEDEPVESCSITVTKAILHNGAYLHNGVAHYGGVSMPMAWS